MNEANPRVLPFERHADRYEAWFTRHRWVYRSELDAIRALLPARGRGRGRAIEIGVGTGRFAGPLGIRVGIEPARAMREAARRRGIEVIAGVAEALPLGDGTFDLALMVTTICFLDDLDAALVEVRRVLRSGGQLVIGFVDRESPVGRAYERQKDENVFYRVADFYSVEELVSHLAGAGFGDFAFTQTIFREPAEIGRPEPVTPGYGQGSFVVVRGTKRDPDKDEG